MSINTFIIFTSLMMRFFLSIIRKTGKSSYTNLHQICTFPNAKILVLEQLVHRALYRLCLPLQYVLLPLETSITVWDYDFPSLERV